MAASLPPVTNIDLAVLDKLDTLYKNAWDRLILNGLLILGVVGIVWPILAQWLTQWYQNRRFKLREEEIRKEIETKLVKLIDEKYEMEKRELEKQYKESIADMKKEIACTRGSTLHVQGISLLSEKQYIAAFGSFLDAMSLFIEGEDNFNLQRVIKGVRECLLNITKNEIVHFENINIKFNSRITELEKYNRNGFYIDYIRDLKEEYKRAKSREKQDNTE